MRAFTVIASLLFSALSPSLVLADAAGFDVIECKVVVDGKVVYKGGYDSDKGSIRGHLVESATLFKNSEVEIYVGRDTQTHDLEANQNIREGALVVSAVFTDQRNYGSAKKPNIIPERYLVSGQRTAGQFDRSSLSETFVNTGIMINGMSKKTKVEATCGHFAGE